MKFVHMLQAKSQQKTRKQRFAIEINGWLRPFRPPLKVTIEFLQMLLGQIQIFVNWEKSETVYISS